MATESSYSIAPLSPETWSAFDALVQRHNGIFGGCWCIWFHPDGPERGQGAEANRALKKAYVEQGKAHAALVMDGAEAIAWAEYGTPVELPTLHHLKEYDATKTADPDYRITCVFVDKRHRRRGVTELAITGALDLIAQAGGGRVESYPSRPDQPDQEDVVVVPLQRHPPTLRAARLHLRPAQRSEELRHGEDGRACMRPGHDQPWPSWNSTRTRARRRAAYVRTCARMAPNAVESRAGDWLIYRQSA